MSDYLPYGRQTIDQDDVDAVVDVILGSTCRVPMPITQAAALSDDGRR
jgi:hypothetical protein